MRRAKLILLGFGVAMGLVLGECMVRLFVAEPEVVTVAAGRYRLAADSRVGYEPVPMAAIDGKRPDRYYDYSEASNSMGFRDYEHAVKLPEGMSRVVFLGDSVTAGQGINNGKAIFTALLGRDLGESVDVMNFAVTGYNTEQEVATLETKALRFQPDLVVLAFCLNDRERNDGGMLRELIRQAKGKRVATTNKSIWHHSALYRFFYYRVLERHKERPKTYERLNQDTVDASLRELSKLADKHGFRVLVAIFPDLKKLKQYTRYAEHASVRAISEELGFDVIDLLPEMQNCNGGPLGIDRYHLTHRGHQCASKALLPKIRSLL